MAEYDRDAKRHKAPRQTSRHVHHVRFMLLLCTTLISLQAFPARSQSNAGARAKLICSEDAKALTFGDFRINLPSRFWQGQSKPHQQAGNGYQLYEQVVANMPQPAKNSQKAKKNRQNQHTFWQNRFMLAFISTYNNGAEEARRKDSAHRLGQCAPDRFLTESMAIGPLDSRTNTIALTLCASPKRQAGPWGTLSLSRFHVRNGALFQFTFTWRQADLQRDDVTTWPISRKELKKALRCLQRMTITRRPAKPAEQDL